mmetsp:Transcript_10979/g.27246  ORF Transcript_10979/g.27246 Transcript_10979/m.27246 type:complete len:103 (+) Transcript_10979:449-757(+)
MEQEPLEGKQEMSSSSKELMAEALELPRDQEWRRFREHRSYGACASFSFLSPMEEEVHSALGAVAGDSFQRLWLPELLRAARGMETAVATEHGRPGRQGPWA